MSQDQVVFSVNDIVKEYSEKDFVPSRPEPREGVFYEWAVGEATLGTAKKGYLQLSMKCNALDSKGATMFTKYMNLALPVAFKGNSPGPWAKGIFNDTIRALVTEHAPYDDVQEDAATGKKVYLKAGQAVTGAAYDAAVKAQAGVVTALLDGITNPGTSIEATAALTGRTFFAQLVTKGEYTNITKILGRKPKDEVVYDRTAAFGKAA